MKDSMKVGKPGVNYYALLGVPSTATPEEITKAFRKKILQVHLDKMGPEEDTEQCYLTIEAHRILSNKALRARYDVERSSSKEYNAQEEKFIPAGYICYDVGHQQMSRQLLDSITNWTSEYEECASELSDNYFNCFSQIMAQVMNEDVDDGGEGENDASEEGQRGIQRKFLTKQQQNQQNYYYCPVCDKRYVTETHHWDSVINPYRAMFFSDQQGIAALNMYFQRLIGQSMFDWELRYLPTRLLGIWGSPEWSMISKLDKQAANILKQCDFNPRPPSSDSESNSDEGTTTSVSTSANVISKLEAMLECSTSKGSNASFTSAQNAFSRRSLIQNLIWVVENRDQTVEQMMSRMNELIMQDDVQEIMCLGMAMRNVLNFESSEWEQMIQDALTQEQFEMAMLWTMLAVESGNKSKGDWFQLGMTIRGMGDAVLAHFCFLLSGCDGAGAWEDLADIFTQNGAHHAAIEYHLNKGNLFQLLNKARALKKVDAESAGIYSGIFYATRVKALLQVLRKRSRQCFSDTCKNEMYNAELEELIEIIQDLGGNALEGFRIIVSTWPDVFEESPGYWIHRATIQYLRKATVNLKSQKLILAGVHYLPEDEAYEEICAVTKEACQVTRLMLERAQETNDFEMLTDVLLHLNKRTLSTAQEYLEEIRPRPPPPPPPEKTEGDEEGNKEADDENIKEEIPAPPPQPPEPSHKSAIFLLLSGTVHKVNEAWLDAMKDYQNALLTAPEVMHRVLPCVSKLVQDIQFHEAVVAQVQQEVHELQESLLKKEYPNVDEFSSDKRRSLIFTDVAPKMDYGYKDSVSKIQADPDKIPPPPPPDEEQMDAPPPPPANTPMVTLDRNQEAIQSGQQDGQMDQLSAALAYVDLLKALPLPMHPGPIVMAASHFLRAMDDNAKPEEIGKLYAYRNAIMLMAENLLRVDKKLQHTIHHGLTHKHMLSILLSSHEKLSKALQLAKKNDNNNHEGKENEDESSLPTSDDEADNNDKAKSQREAEDNTNKNSTSSQNKKDLIRKSEAHVISKFFQNVVNFPKVEPLASIPTLNCSDLVYVETLGNSFLSQFCADKVRQKHQSPLIPKHLHAYTHFVEVWKGRSTLSDFPQARVKAMEELLALKGWTMGDVQSKMTWPILTLQPDGFSPTMECLLKLRDPFRSYRSIDGFHINYESGTVELLMSRDLSFPVDTLFDLYDILDVVYLSKAGLDKVIFSLETPDGGVLNSHPFKEARFTLAGQNNKAHSQQQQQKMLAQIPDFVMTTCTRVSMLLCYLASGLEMCSETPFWMRRTDEGLLARLDEHLQYLARPIGWRKAERRENNEKSPFESETMGKFRLNMVEVFEEIEEDDEEGHENHDQLPIVQSSRLTYRVGEMRTEIRPNTLVMTLDPKRGTQKLSPEAEFCRDLTKHFKEFSRAFPELQRLEELVKLSIVCSKLRQVLKENKALIQEFQSKSHPSSSSSDAACDSNRKVKAVQRVCSVIESFLSLQNPQQQQQQQEKNTSSSNGGGTCNWLPATFCHNMDPDVYDVTAVLELDPVVTYGPVPAPSKPIRVPLEKLIELGGGHVSVIGAEIDSKPVIDDQQQQKKNKNANNMNTSTKVENENGKQVEREREVVNEEEGCDDSEENDDDDDVSGNNRILCAVPEESDEEENDDEWEEEEDEQEVADNDEVCKERNLGVASVEEEVSEYENEISIIEEEEISVEDEEQEGGDDDEDENAVADEIEVSESYRGSPSDAEIDTDESDFEDAVEEKEETVQVANKENNSSGEAHPGDKKQAADNDDGVDEDENVPTLTFIIKRPSITSQTDEDNSNESDKIEVEKDSRKESEEECSENEVDCNDNDDRIKRTSEGEIDEEIVSEDEESESVAAEDECADGIEIDNNKDNEIYAANETNSCSDEEEEADEDDGVEIDEEKADIEGENINEDNIKNIEQTEQKEELSSSYEEYDMENEESENLEDEDEEEQSAADEKIECNGNNGNNENGNDNAEKENCVVDNGTTEESETDEAEESCLDELNETADKKDEYFVKNKNSAQNKIEDSSKNNDLNVIEGKSAIKLRKVNVNVDTPTPITPTSQNLTKRSFLNRRGRLMVQGDKVMGSIVSESLTLEKTDTDSEDGELILPEK